MTDKQKIKVLKGVLKNVNVAVKECKVVEADDTVFHTEVGGLVINELEEYQTSLKWVIKIAKAYDDWGRNDSQ